MLAMRFALQLMKLWTIWMAFEEEFGSEISDSEAEKILTVGDAVKFIEGKAN